MRCVLLFLLLCLLPAPLTAVPMSAPEMARHEASAFLELLDRQEYQRAWQVSDPYLRSRMTLKEWRRVLRSNRQPLGQVSARRQLQAKHLDLFEIAPVGIFVQIEFASLFGRRERIERLVVRKGEDGRWRIVSYQIR